MKKTLIGMLLILATLPLMGGCTTIETGEIGLRRSFNGTIDDDELMPGIHQNWVGKVIEFVTKEILLGVEDMTPQSKDKSSLKDFDISFTYNVEPNEISYLYTKYSTTAHLSQQGHQEIFPMGNFVLGIVRASAYSAVANYDALEINNNRTALEQAIARLTNEKLKGEGLEGKVRVVSVNVKNIQLADDVVASANNAVKAQNDLKTKTTEVEIARQEAERIKVLAAQSGDDYIRLLNAQAGKVQADALLVVAHKGSTIWVVPGTFTGLGNVPSTPAH